MMASGWCEGGHVEPSGMKAKVVHGEYVLIAATQRPWPVSSPIQWDNGGQVNNATVPTRASRSYCGLLE